MNEKKLKKVKEGTITMSIENTTKKESDGLKRTIPYDNFLRYLSLIDISLKDTKMNKKELIDNTISEVIGCLEDCKERYCPIDVCKLRRVLNKLVNKSSNLMEGLKC